MPWEEIEVPTVDDAPLAEAAAAEEEEAAAAEAEEAEEAEDREAMTEFGKAVSV